jgi:hypothetical protein
MRVTALPKMRATALFDDLSRRAADQPVGLWHFRKCALQCPGLARFAPEVRHLRPL